MQKIVLIGTFRGLARCGFYLLACLLMKVFLHYLIFITLNAVIIDGMSSKWVRKADDVPLSFGEFTYERAHTQFYRVNSSSSFCDALKDASHQFGAKVQNLQIYGHGIDQSGQNSNQFIKLSEDYFFNGTETQIDCIQKYLKEKAHLLLVSCNTATKTESNSVSLTERIAQLLPSINITGFAAFFNPLLVSNWINSDKNLSLESHLWVDINERVVFPKNAVFYPATT